MIMMMTPLWNIVVEGWRFSIKQNKTKKWGKFFTFFLHFLNQNNKNFQLSSSSRWWWIKLKKKIRYFLYYYYATYIIYIILTDVTKKKVNKQQTNKKKRIDLTRYSINQIKWNLSIFFLISIWFDIIIISWVLWFFQDLFFLFGLVWFVFDSCVYIINRFDSTQHPFDNLVFFVVVVG